MARLIYILVYCFIFDATNALDECKDKVPVSMCKRYDKQCINPRGSWIDYMEKHCMSTCRYCTTENVALGKNTAQSSSLVRTGYNSSNAVDGEIQDKYGSCSATSNNDVKSWWCVDLEKQYTLNEIRVFGESKAIDSLTNFDVILSNTGSCNESTLRSSPVCYKDPGSTRNLYSIDRCNEGNVDFNGRFVFITTDKKNKSLGLCEVQVNSARCSDGFYERSIGRCSPCKCNGETCDPDTGHCLKKCPIHCKNDKCDVTGRCTDGCNVGFYGSDCTDECSPNCKDDVCNETGVCSDCREGFYGDVCSKSCSNNCKLGGCNSDSGVCNNGCKRGFYGARCKSNCSTCKQFICKDGVCTHGCLDGFYGRGGWCLRKCPNCLAGGCDKDTGVCISGCIQGWYTDKCNTSCSSDCQGGCDRSTGTCTTCSPGRYGDTCQHECSTGCQGGCNRLNGECTTCSPGRYGDTCQHECSIGCHGGCNRLNGICTACSSGRYGDYCQHECSNGCVDNICNKDGSCSCKATHYGDNCNITCSDGCMNSECSSYGGFCSCKGTHYGEKCEQECSNKCINKQCTTSSESSKPRCTRGCVNGYKGSYCQSPCPVNCVTCNTTDCSVCRPGWYGNKCQTPCPINCPNECHSVSGECGQCEGNTFGRFCNITCSDRCRSQGRDKTCNIAGDCLFGCVDGNYGNRCELKCAKYCSGKCSKQDGQCYECIPGYYGNYCNNPCSSTCLEGCKGTNGYCNKCVNGYYGETCNQPCSKTCEGGCNRDGKCLRCSKGFYGEYCDKNCSNNCIESDCEGPINDLVCSKGCVEGKRGRYCSKNCPQHCIHCDQFNKYLCSACKAGWWRSYCYQRCPPGCIKCDQKGNCLSCKSGFFGERCDKPCPTGCVNDVCHMNGTCNACTSGLYSFRCNHECSKNCNATTGASVCDFEDGSCVNGCVAGKEGQNCSEDCTDGWYGINCVNKCGSCKSGIVCNVSNGACGLQGCHELYTGPTCHDEKPSTSNVTVVIVVILTVVILVLAVIAGLYVWRKRNRRPAPSYSETVPLTRKPDVVPVEIGAVTTINTDGATFSGNVENTVYENTVETSPTPTRILLKDLWKYTQDKIKDGSLVEEYQKLPSGLCQPHDVAMSPENKSKNRYKLVCAYDHTRVKLEIENGNPHSDYINACYISGYKTEKPAYIASQGPIPVNIKEFWRMIWDVGAGKVVMLTNLVELGTSKCSQYWPALGKQVEYGSISITMIQENIFAHFTIRTLQISRDGSDKRTINQFHYTAWPDKAVPPDVVSLIEFRELLNKSPTKQSGPTVVHCSAGIGRTGTFLAMDYLIEEAKAEDSVGVFDCVSRMRNERVNMVQTKNQYCFLHEALAEWYLLYETTTPVTSYQSVLQNLLKQNRRTGLSKLQKKFQMLSKVCPKQDERDLVAALSEENKNKNKDSTILASDNHRPYLVTEVDGCTDYINAVYLPSYTRKQAFILTQTPLNNTHADFWRLIVDARVPIIVDIDPVTNSNPYLPSVSTTKQFGPLHVTCSEENVHKEVDYYTINKYTIKHTSDKEFKHDVKLYKCNFWTDESVVPESASPIFHVLEDIHNSYPGLNYTPLLVHCQNGVDKSGLFMVLAGIIERLTKEQNVSVVQVIEQFRRARPQIITCYEQFRFCFDAIGEYLDQFSDYANSC